MLDRLRWRALRVMRRALRTADRTIAQRLLASSSGGHKPFLASMAEGYATGFAGCPCVFTLSTGRVGTETLTAVLDQSPHIIATHEPAPILVEPSYAAYMTNGDEERWVAVVASARGESVVEACQAGKIYAETNNRMTYMAKALSSAFPSSKFIHLHRHPYEVIHSGLRRSYYKTHPWDFARIRPRPGEEFAEQWDDMPPLEKVAWYWRAVNQHAIDSMEALPDSRRFVLRSADLFGGRESALEALFSFVGVELPPRARIDSVLSLNLNRQRGGAPVAPPAEWSTVERDRVRRIVGDVASALEYDL